MLLSEYVGQEASYMWSIASDTHSTIFVPFKRVDGQKKSSGETGIEMGESYELRVGN